MSFPRVDGLQLSAMLKNGLYYLSSNAEYINNLNVFPVADGDTGINMTKTLESGLNNIAETTHVGLVLKSVSEGMLFGARGNSGVILSQFFRGMYEELSRKELLGPGELRNGLIEGYKTAYQAVARPVEGTILTVARQGIENIRTQISRKTSVDAILSMYIAEMKKSLSFTPELLPVLKESNVVDSGAYGFICIFEGMLKYLFGETLEGSQIISDAKSEVKETSLYFDENSDFTEGYCLEFILQLMKSGKYNPRFEINKFIDDLQLYGNSVVAVKDNMLVKVHIHTTHLSRTISLCEEYGVFVDFKIDNMQLQKNATAQKKESKSTKTEFAKIAVANGNGIKEIYENLGCDLVIGEKNGDSVSTNDFYNAIVSANAKKSVIFANNKNSVMAAQQAKNMFSDDTDIMVVPTENVMEGYFALALDIPDSNDTEQRIKNMMQYKEGLDVIGITVSQKQGCFDGVNCEIGDYISIINGKIAVSEKDMTDAITKAFNMCDDLSLKDACVVFYGKDISKEKMQSVEQSLNTAFSHIETECFSGGQEVYSLLIGLV